MQFRLLSEEQHQSFLDGQSIVSEGFCYCFCLFFFFMNPLLIGRVCGRGMGHRFSSWSQVWETGISTVEPATTHSDSHCPAGTQRHEKQLPGLLATAKQGHCSLKGQSFHEVISQRLRESVDSEVIGKRSEPQLRPGCRKENEALVSPHPVLILQMPYW